MGLDLPSAPSTAKADVGESTPAKALRVVAEQLEIAAAAEKCHGCGCFHQTVGAFEGTAPGQRELAPILAEARKVFRPKQYDCLGCQVCYPAVAANAFADAFPTEAESLESCPADMPAERRGWPPFPGDYHAIRYRAPVAVCTLNSTELAARLSGRLPEGLAIAGTLHTENLGIERIIQNVLANPNIRFLILAGPDTQQAVGHLPGQSLVSLFEKGMDDRGRIVDARGKRPVLKNVRQQQVEAFLTQVELVAMIDEENETKILNAVSDCASRTPGPFKGAPEETGIQVISASEPGRLALDPAGFLVLYPDAARRRLIAEHYSNAGVLGCVIEGDTASAVYGTVIERGLVTQLDHAAYLGRELARAERTLETGEPYVQDRAAGETPSEPRPLESGCASECTSKEGR